MHHAFSLGQRTLAGARLTPLPLLPLSFYTIGPIPPDLLVNRAEPPSAYFPACLLPCLILIASLSAALCGWSFLHITWPSHNIGYGKALITHTSSTALSLPKDTVPRGERKSLPLNELFSSWQPYTFTHASTPLPVKLNLTLRSCSSYVQHIT